MLNFKDRQRARRKISRETTLEAIARDAQVMQDCEDIMFEIMSRGSLIDEPTGLFDNDEDI